MVAADPLAYAQPKGGASLLVAFSGAGTEADEERRTCLIVGGGSVAATRALAALESDMRVALLAPADGLCDELRYRVARGQVDLVSVSNDDFDIGNIIDSQRPTLVCITDTSLSAKMRRRSAESAARLRRACRARGVPLNVSDMPQLCDFTFLSTHRTGSFQLGTTTNGRGCRLAGRLRRQIAAALPHSLDHAVDNLGKLRDMARLVECPQMVDQGDAEAEGAQIHAAPADSDVARRRMAWIAQMSEYWPIDSLAALAQGDMVALLDEAPAIAPNAVATTTKNVSQQLTDIDNVPKSAPPTAISTHELTLAPSQGRVYLVGSGPGHPSLLTVAAHRLLLSADIHAVLSDKLVPTGVLDLIPSTKQLHIARKFPGNADRAQDELTALGIRLLQEGKNIVRLKQGDPCVFGRAGEEILAYRAAGFEPTIVPGLSAALSGPALARPPIPVTQRGVADSLAICTGVGRGGATASLPGYQRARTTCLLMAAARVSTLVADMTAPQCERRGDGVGAPYPPYLPVALLERATMPDQRVLSTTLEHLEEAMAALGEARPPGMLVVGWSVLCMDRGGHVDVLDKAFDEDAEAKDGALVREWLDGERWRTVEGLAPSWLSL